MDLKTIKALTKMMSDHGLVELEVEAEDLKVRMSKSQNVAPVTNVAPMVPAAASAAPVSAAEGGGQAAAAASPASNNYREITSPIPGTVYLKANPDVEPFLSVGSQVKEGEVTCLVEAMKVFNEIKAEGVSGVVKEICVEDGQAVEYGTVLFLIG